MTNKFVLKFLFFLNNKIHLLKFISPLEKLNKKIVMEF